MRYRHAGAGRAVARPAAQAAAMLPGMHPITLLEPLSYLSESPTAGFADTPQALEYHSQAGSVRFDKATGTMRLDPPTADVLALLQELQALVTDQEASERAGLLAKLARRPY